MGSPIVSPPDPWAATGLKTVPVQPADPWAATGLKTVPVSPSAAGGSWTPNVGQEIEQSRLGQAHPTLAKIAGVAANTGAGVLKGAGQLLSGLDNTSAGRWLNSYGGLRSPAATQADTDAYQRLTTPSGPAQGLAAGATRLAGNVAEGVMLPEAEGGVLARMAAQGLMGAGLSKANGGSALAGAIGGGAAEGAGTALRAVAPKIAQSALGARAIDLAFGKTPGLALLNDSRGLTMGRVAQSSQDTINRLMPEIEGMAQDASRPTVIATPNRRLALPPGPPPEPIPIPLHEATATVEKASPLQPAMVGARAPILARDAGRILAAPEQVELRAPEYRNATAMENVGTPTIRSAGDAAAVNRQAALADNGGSIFIRPGGNGEVIHPMTHPLNTVQVAEPAQGVWLRTPEGPIEIGPTTPERAGFTLDQPTVSLRSALGPLDEDIANVAENSPTKFNTLKKVRDNLTINRNGAPIPADVSPSRALALKRGVREEFGRFNGDPAFDHSVASGAAKAASGRIDETLDKALGPEFASKNQRVSSLVNVKDLADRRSRGAGIEQRFLHRLGAHTGGMASGAALGGAYGSTGGRGSAATDALLGALIGEGAVSSPALLALARGAYAPVTKRLLRGALVGGTTAATK